MTAKLENKEEPALLLKEKCIKCFRGPNLIKTLVVAVCLGVVVYQISTCVGKLINLPITTYTHFDFNKTIMYPSITFCREPPYKFDKMLEYGLFAHPQYTSEWRHYNFSVPLDELWKNITYEASEIFVQYGLDNEMYNVEVTETIGFVRGRCYTLSPKIQMTQATRSSGLSITLQHNAQDIANSVGEYPPGYHAYVHYTREPFTEVEVYNGGLVDYLYCNIGETMDVKLTVDQYVMISEDTDPCTHDSNYSANKCTTEYVWAKIEETAGCSGPWMHSKLPLCDNFESMRNLIVAYMAMYEHHNCSICPRFCSSYLYNGYVTDRHSSAWDTITYQWIPRNGPSTQQTQIFLYFSSMMVSVYEERYNYDWNLFLSDLGGSVGFLLGLSVIGLMSIFGKVWSYIVTPRIKTAEPKDDQNNTPTGSDNISKNEDYIDKTGDYIDSNNKINLKHK